MRHARLLLLLCPTSHAAMNVSIFSYHRFLTMCTRRAISEFREDDHARIMIFMVDDLKFMAATWRHVCSNLLFPCPHQNVGDTSSCRMLAEQTLSPSTVSVLMEGSKDLVACISGHIPTMQYRFAVTVTDVVLGLQLCRWSVTVSSCLLSWLTGQLISAAYHNIA